MKADQIFASRQTALLLKAAGIILVLGVLINYLVLAIPPDFLNSIWLVNLINGWVGRGTVPLLGVAFIVFGVWIDRFDNADSRRSGLLLATLILSLLLGVLFLLFVPLHLYNSQLAIEEQTSQINQQAATAEQQLDTLLAQQEERVSALLADEQQVARLQQELDSAQLPPEQQAQLEQVRQTLEKVKADPNALDQEIEKERAKRLEQIQQQQQQALEQAQTQMHRSRNQAMFSSTLLAIGYFVIGGTGLNFIRSESNSQRRLKKQRK